MKTRNLNGIGAAAFALGIIGVVAFAQQGQTQEKVAHSKHHEMMQECAKACSDCQRACDTCATHCANLLVESKNESLTSLAKHMASLTNCQDCTNCCAAAAQITARGGPQSAVICECCAKACDHCARRAKHSPTIST